jgi:GGDEF domain-containing protein
MISIQSSLSELERAHQIRTVVLDSYVLAINNVAHYAVDLEGEVTATHRKHLAALATEVASGSQDALVESRATLRGLLRTFREQTVAYLNGLREELTGSARALEQILDSLSQSDGDHEARLRNALKMLRDLATDPTSPTLGAIVSTAAVSIEKSLEDVRKQHQLTVSQFLVEIRMLHKRIDSLETAATVDQATQFANQQEMEQRIRSAPPGGYCLLLIVARGLRRAEAQFGTEVANELAGAFSKSLRNSLPASAIISRWGSEQFVVMLGGKKSEAAASGKWITDHLSGAYSCLKEGKSIHTPLQLNIGIVDSATTDLPDRILQRVGSFLGTQG